MFWAKIKSFTFHAVIFEARVDKKNQLITISLIDFSLVFKLNDEI